MIDLQTDQESEFRLYDVLPDPIAWYSPVFSTGEGPIVDFELGYCNAAFCRAFHLQKEDAVGSRLLTAPFFEETHRDKVFDNCTAVFRGIENTRYVYHSGQYGQHFEVSVYKLLNGVLTLFKKQSGKDAADVSSTDKEQHYHNILDTSQEGILILRALRGTADRIDDFQIEYCNRSGFELGRFPKDCIGKAISEVLPNLKPEELDRHRQVVITGEPLTFETSFTTPEGLPYGWFNVALTKIGDGVVSRYTDVSERKKHEQLIESQKSLLDNVFDAALDGMFIAKAIRDNAGTIVDLEISRINHAFTKMTGLTEKDVLEKTYLTNFPSAKQNGVFDLDCHVINTGEPVRQEVYYTGGHLDAWYDFSVCRIGDESILVSFSDITQIKKAFVEIQQQKLLLDNIFRYAPIGIGVYKVLRDETGKITDIQCVLANSAVEKLTGIPNDVRLRNNIFQITPEYKSKGHPEILMKTMETGEPAQVEFYHPVSRRWLEYSIARIDSEQLLNVFKDITAAKEAYLKTESLLQELKRSNADLQEFAYVASHDLQEPLRKIHFFSESLKRSLPGNASEEFLHKLARMQHAADRMARLIDDLLKYSKAGEKPHVFEWIELNDIVEQVLQDLEATIAETAASIHVDKLPLIKGDESQLRQMFLNIISNALKYRKRGIPPEISVSVGAVSANDDLFRNFSKETLQQFHLIEIKDNGIGFPQEYAERIFQIFQRLHARAEYEGTGIGLAIVQKVVANHHGFITAISEPGKGSSFRILLPRSAFVGDDLLNMA